MGITLILKGVQKLKKRKLKFQVSTSWIFEPNSVRSFEVIKSVNFFISLADFLWLSLLRFFFFFFMDRIQITQKLIF